MPYADKEKRKEHLRNKYALDPAWRQNRLAYQRKWNKSDSEKRLTDLAGRPRPEHCEVCGGQGAGRSKDVTTVWDHDHATGMFRGWICGPCNSILGFANDDASRLRKLANYVEGIKTASVG